MSTPPSYGVLLILRGFTYFHCDAFLWLISCHILNFPCNIENSFHTDCGKVFFGICEVSCNILQGFCFKPTSCADNIGYCFCLNLPLVPVEMPSVTASLFLLVLIVSAGVSAIYVSEFVDEEGVLVPFILKVFVNLYEILSLPAFLIADSIEVRLLGVDHFEFIHFNAYGESVVHLVLPRFPLALYR